MDNEQISENSKKPKKESSSWEVIKGLIIVSIGVFLIFDYFNDWENTNAILNKFSRKESIINDKLYKGKTSSKYSNENQKERLKTLVAAVDIENPITNDFAVKLASIFPGEYNIGQICSIYDYIVKNWKYVNDGNGHENFRSASRTIQNNLAGDCDDFAILMAAAIMSINGDVRINTAWNNEGGHAFAEVLVASNSTEMESMVNEIVSLYNYKVSEVAYTKDKAGNYWLNLDWFGRPQHPGGKYFDYTNREIYYLSNRPYYEVLNK